MIYNSIKEKSNLELNYNIILYSTHVFFLDSECNGNSDVWQCYWFYNDMCDSKRLNKSQTALREIGYRKQIVL